MHSECGSFTAFGSRTERVLRDASHGIDHGVSKLKQLLFLFANERREFALVVIAAKQGARTLVCFFGRIFADRFFGGFFWSSFFLFWGGNKLKRRSPGRAPKNGGLIKND